MFDEFGRDNDLIKSLICPEPISSNPMTTIPSRRIGASAIHKPIVQFWQNARTLYNFIGRSWRCSCHELHQSNLLLQHRDNEDVEFNILFLFGNSALDDTHTWGWQDIKLQPVEPSNGDQDVESVSQETLEKPTGPATNKQPNKHRSSRFSSRFRKVVLSLRFKSKQ